MSYILDALKRSERERHGAQAATPLPTSATNVGASWKNAARWLAAGLMLNAFALGWILLRPQTVPTSLPITEPAVLPLPGKAAETAESAPDVAPPAAEPVQPAPTQPPRSASSVSSPSPAAKKPAPTQAEPPLLEELPLAQRESLPPLQVNVHVYSEQAQSRFVLINLKRYREGGRLDQGLTVERITPDGVILRAGEIRFKLRRNKH